MKRIALASALLLSASLLQAHGPAKTYGPPSEVQDLYSVASEPSADRIQADIQTLVDFGTRHTLSETESETPSAVSAVSLTRQTSSPFSRYSAARSTRTAMS